MSTEEYGTIFDVYSNIKYRWTVSKRDEVLKQVPYILLTEYRQDIAALLVSFDRFISLTAKGGISQLKRMISGGTNAITGNLDINPNKGWKEIGYNPYEDLYHGKKTGNVYRFPWYSDYHHMINNTWDDMTGALEAVISTTADKLNRFLSPAGGLDTPKAWSTIEPGTFQFEFSLINTDFDSGDFNPGITNHMDLIDSLILANIPMRDGFLTMLPPCIYTLEIPGVRYSPACVITNLEINNIGQMNRYSLPDSETLESVRRQDCIIPDEWKIRIVITELIRESNLIYKSLLDKDQQVIAISTRSDSAEVQKISSKYIPPTPTPKSPIINPPSIFKGGSSGGGGATRGWIEQ